MKENKKQLQDLHDQIKNVAEDLTHDELHELCWRFQNHINALEDDDSGSNPQNPPPPPPPPVGH